MNIPNNQLHKLLLTRFNSYVKTHGVRHACVMIMRVAKNKGLLPFPSTLRCVDCGSRAYCYDHRDYSQPFKVQPTCRRCNLARGRAENASWDMGLQKRLFR